MEDFVSKAVEKIEGGVSSVKDRYGKVVARPVADALISFCRQQGEFAQAVAEITEEQRAAIIAEANSQMSAEMAAKDAELARLRLVANPEVSKFSAYLDQMQTAFKNMKEILAGADPEVADRLGGALAKVVAMMAERV